MIFSDNASTDSFSQRVFLAHLFDAVVTRALSLHNTAAFLPAPPKGRTVVIGAGKVGGCAA